MTWAFRVIIVVVFLVRKLESGNYRVALASHVRKRLSDDYRLDISFAIL